MRVGFLKVAVSAALLATSYASAHAQTGGISGGTVKIGVPTADSSISASRPPMLKLWQPTS